MIDLDLVPNDSLQRELVTSQGKRVKVRDCSLTCREEELSATKDRFLRRVARGVAWLNMLERELSEFRGWYETAAAKGVPVPDRTWGHCHSDLMKQRRLKRNAECQEESA
jgi:hypothetical protein